MKIASYCLMTIVLLPLMACGQVKKYTHPQSEEEILFAKTSALMKSHVQLLRAAGRWPQEGEDGGGDGFTELGHYDWHSGKSGGYFGAYSFSQEAFEQAMRSWKVGRAQIAEGSDILVNVGRGGFDKSAVGYSVGYMTYCSLHGGVLHHCEEPGFPGARVIEFIDSTHLRLDKKAKWDAEFYGLQVTPPDYMDMCNCTNNFSPFQSTTPAQDPKTVKPCVQGGSLAPGASCSVSISIPVQ